MKGIKQNWRSDLLASFSVALVALPLSLGISIASGIPPIAGLLSAIIAGLVMTWYRGTSIGINGPAAGLIVITLWSVQMFEETNPGSGYPITLAAFIMAGVLMLLMGIFKLGRFGNLLPSSVIRGMLAGIGVIILTKQIDEVVGIPAQDGSILTVLSKIPEALMNMNPIIALIGFLSIAILVIYPRIKNRMIHFIPGPMWVLILTLPFVFIFGINNEKTYEFLGSSYSLGPKYLIDIPSNILDGLTFPIFTALANPNFWLVVISVFLVSAIEGLLSAKGAENLDPDHRKSDLNKDMVGSGISTILAGAIGAPPVITVIARTSVNVQNGAKSGLSNFFHGALILIFVLVLSPVIKMIPLAALAGILIYTGYKLASPKVFASTWEKGWEQFIIFIVTLYGVLEWGLIEGIVVGTILTLLLHYVISGIPFRTFWSSLRKPFINAKHRTDKVHHVRVTGISNFLAILGLQKELDAIPEGEEIIMDFSHARVVDSTVLEFVDKFAKSYRIDGGEMEFTGLDNHHFSSHHPYSLHTLPPGKRYKLTNRQKDLGKLADKNNWDFQRQVNRRASYLRNFSFFSSRPIEYKNNVISSRYEDLNVDWEIADITFDEGTFTATEVHNTTVQLIRLPFEIPVFSLEKEDLFDRIMDLADHHEIDFENFKNFSKVFDVSGPNKDEIRTFFKPELITFFENKEIYHVESNGNALIVFRFVSRAKSGEISKMVDFSHDLTKQIMVCQGVEMPS